MPNPFIYAVNADNKLLWFRHSGVADGTFNWQGPHEVGRGWNFKHVFSGGDGIIYAIEPVVEATVHITGGTTPASGGNLLWFRHVGQADGSFLWEGPKKVGTGWGHFEHVFYGGNGIIYAVEPRVEASVHVTGRPTPASGGELLWFRHLGREDGSFKWEGSKKVGTGWSGFEHIFSGGDGVIYVIEPFVEATVHVTGRPTPASGGNLRWYRHLGQQDGSFKWEGPQKVGTGWSGLKQVFSGDDGVIYAVEQVVEATVPITGRVIPASGGNLRWFRHLGRKDGSFRWEGPKKVGSGWGGFKEVLSGGGGAVSVGVNDNGGRFCDFPDPPQGVGLHSTAYTLKGTRRKLTLRWAINSILQIQGPTPTSAVLMQQVLTNAFAVWENSVPALNFQFVQSAVTSPFAPTNPDVDITIGIRSFPSGSPTLGSTSPDGTSIVFNNATSWVASNPTPPGSTDLLAVAVHEIGHAIGLLHSTSDNSIMNPFNGNREVLTSDDVNAARALYGWETQQSIPNRGSDSGPAICACGGVLAMAWKGIGGDDNIFYASSRDGLTWTEQKVVEGVGTSDAPSLAWDGTRLWMAWTGIPGDSSLFYATTTDPTTWPANPGIPIGNVGSSNGPSIAMTPAPTLVWKGVEGDSGIFFSTFNAANNPQWSSQQHIPGIGSSDRPVLVTDVTGQPLMVWKGIEGDSDLFATTQTGFFWQPQQVVSWIVPGNGGQGTIDVSLPGTSCGPGITTDGARVFVAWRGAGNDSGIWFTQRTNDVVGGVNIVEWSSQGNIPDVGTSHRPAVAFFAGRLYLAWKGVGDDTTLWITRL